MDPTFDRVSVRDVVEFGVPEKSHRPPRRREPDTSGGVLFQPQLEIAGATDVVRPVRALQEIDECHARIIEHCTSRSAPGTQVVYNTCSSDVAGYRSTLRDARKLAPQGADGDACRASTTLRDARKLAPQGADGHRPPSSGTAQGPDDVPTRCGVIWDNSSEPHHDLTVTVLHPVHTDRSDLAGCTAAVGETECVLVQWAHDLTHIELAVGKWSALVRTDRVGRTQRAVGHPEHRDLPPVDRVGAPLAGQEIFHRAHDDTSVDAGHRTGTFGSGRSGSDDVNCAGDLGSSRSSQGSV